MSLLLRNAAPFTYLITSGRAATGSFHRDSTNILDLIRYAADLGVTLIQIRERSISTALLLELTKSAAEITRKTATKLLVNDRADVAVAAGADGVHLTSSSMPTMVVRKCFGDDFLIGVSCHSFDEVSAAQAGGADFAVFGPVFASPGKGMPTGLVELGRVCRRVPTFPVIALGGITIDNAEQALEAGAAGIAGIRSMNDRGMLKDLVVMMRDRPEKN